MRNRKLIWVLVVMILIITAMAGGVEGAIMDRLRGAGRLGPFLVNTVILSALFAFGFSFLGKKIDGKTGNVLMIIISIVLGLVIAINILGRVYIWNYPVVDNIFGIFKEGTRLGIFVGATALFMWLFTYLNVGGDKEGANKINIVLALVIGFHLATAEKPDVGMVIRAGELIGLLIIYKNVQETVGENKFLAIGLSAFLVFWISSMTFPQYAMFGENWLWKLTGKGGSLVLQIGALWAAIHFTKGSANKKLKYGLPLGIVGVIIALNFIPKVKEYGLFSGLKGIGLIIALLVLGGATFIGGKKDGERKGWLYNFARGDIGNKITRVLSRIPILNWLFTPKQYTKPGQEPETVRELHDWIDVFEAFNWRVGACKQHTDNVQPQMAKAEQMHKELGEWKDKRALRAAMRAYEFGALPKEEREKIEKRIEEIEAEIKNLGTTLRSTDDPTEKKNIMEEIDDQHNAIDECLEELTKVRVKVIEFKDRSTKELHVVGYQLRALRINKLTAKQRALETRYRANPEVYPRNQYMSDRESVQEQINSERGELEREQREYKELHNYYKLHESISQLQTAITDDYNTVIRYTHQFFFTDGPRDENGELIEVKYRFEGTSFGQTPWEDEFQEPVETDEHGFVLLDKWDLEDTAYEIIVGKYYNPGNEEWKETGGYLWGYEEALEEMKDLGNFDFEKEADRLAFIDGVRSKGKRKIAVGQIIFGRIIVDEMKKYVIHVNGPEVDEPVDNVEFSKFRPQNYKKPYLIVKCRIVIDNEHQVVKPIRWVQKKDMWRLEGWTEYDLVDYIWRKTKDDRSDGRYHPQSRTAEDYVQAMKKARRPGFGRGPTELDDNSILHVSVPPSNDKPAFDKRAKYITGKFWRCGGPKYVRGKGRKIISLKYLPTVSMKGFKQYFKDKLRREILEVKEADEWLRKIEQIGEEAERGGREEAGGH